MSFHASKEVLSLPVGICTYVRLPGIAANLRNQKIDAKRRVLVFEVFLDLVNGLLQHLRVLAKPSNDADAACVGDSGGQLRTSRDVHACREKVRRLSNDLSNDCATGHTYLQA